MKGRRTCLGVLAVMAVGLLAAHKDTPLLQQPPSQDLARVNPFEKQGAAEAAGRKLFQRECSQCHGAGGKGTERGPGLAWPALSQTPPGAIFWVLRNGSWRHGMPSFAHLPEPQRWQIVSYLKSLH